MVSIEYSSNSRASCQKCRGKIAAGEIRVVTKGAPVSNSSGYINKYTHASCYTNRKDFTQLYGFRDLDKNDQMRFMTEDQKRSHFPADYVDVKALASASSSSSSTSEGGAGGLQKRSINSTNTGHDDEQLKKKQKSKATPKEEKKKSPPLIITGLKYAEVCASVGEEVTLVREPENQYDTNAIKVLSKSNNKLIGRIKKDQSASLAKSWDGTNIKLASKGEKLVAVGTIVNSGNGFEQSVQVEYRKVMIDGADGGGNVAAAGVGGAGVTAKALLKRMDNPLY